MSEQTVSNDRMIDPLKLRPGTRIRHKSGSLHTLDRRKEDGSGWWLVEGGGLYDGAWTNRDWTVVSAPPQTESRHYEPALRCRRCHHFLMPHDVEGHDKWHEEPRR